MKNTFYTLIALFISFTISIAQTTEKPNLNAISFELGKTGFIYNLNFDHKFSNKKFGFRLGLGSSLGRNRNHFTYGGGSYYLFGNQNKFFELGLDLQYLRVEDITDDVISFASIFVYPTFEIKTIYPSLNLGFRKYGVKSMFRIGFSPGIIDNKFIPGGYISQGFAF